MTPMTSNHGVHVNNWEDAKLPTQDYFEKTLNEIP